MTDAATFGGPDEQRKPEDGPLMSWDQYKVDLWEKVRLASEEALAAGKKTLSVTLPPMTWWELVQSATTDSWGYSRLLSDLTLHRLDSAIAKLHDEVSYMVSMGPAGTVSERIIPENPTPRQMASPELRRQMREKDERDQPRPGLQDLPDDRVQRRPPA